MIVQDGRAYLCKRCGVTKPLTLEHFYIGAKGQVTGYCRTCMRAWWLDYSRTSMTAYQKKRHVTAARESYRRRFGVEPAQYRGVYRLPEDAA